MNVAPSTREQLTRLVPMAVAAVALGVTAEMLVAVRPVEPLDTPIPVIDERALGRVADDDRAAADRAMKNPPPVEIRSIGSAYLAWNEAGANATSMNEAEHSTLQRELRTALGVARQTLGEEHTKQGLDELRSVHTERWLCTLRRAKLLDVDPFCRALLASQPKEDDAAELKRLGGVLPEILARNGWIDSTGMPRVPESILRARYALHWTSIVLGLDDCDRGAPPVCYGLTSLPLPVDELRALLAFLVAHPVVRDVDMAAAENDPIAAADRRRLVYVERMVALDRFADPSGKTHPYTQGYPVELARGAMLYRLGDYAQAVDALRAAAEENRSDFRARNWLLAALQKLEG